jgi:hypothetical protein
VDSYSFEEFGGAQWARGTGSVFKSDSRGSLRSRRSRRSCTRQGWPRPACRWGSTSAGSVRRMLTALATPSLWPRSTAASTESMRRTKTRAQRACAPEGTVWGMGTVTRCTLGGGRGGGAVGNARRVVPEGDGVGAVACWARVWVRWGPAGPRYCVWPNGFVCGNGIPR